MQNPDTSPGNPAAGISQGPPSTPRKPCYCGDSGDCVELTTEYGLRKGFYCERITGREKATELQRRIDAWATTKLALDAARPDFTGEQLRDLEAQEALLLSLATDEASGAKRSAPAELPKQPMRIFESEP